MQGVGFLLSTLQAETEAVVGQDGTVRAVDGVLLLEPSPLPPDTWPLRAVEAHLSDPVSGRRVVPVGDLSQLDVLESGPIRQPAEFHGQRNHPGTFWSHVEQAHLDYESRHELSRLLLADYDPNTRAVRTQPLTFAGRRDCGMPVTPDILLSTVHGTRLIEVKTTKGLRDPRTRLKLRASRALADYLGWSYEVFLAIEPQLLRNLQFLHDYQDASRISPSALDSVLAAADRLDSPFRLGDLEANEAILGDDLRAAVLHAIRTHKVQADLRQPLDLDMELSRRGPRPPGAAVVTNEHRLSERVHS